MMMIMVMMVINHFNHEDNNNDHYVKKKEYRKMCVTKEDSFTIQLYSWWKIVLHFLSNGGVFLEKKIYINIKVTYSNAPRHSSNNLTLEKDSVKAL